MIILFRMRAGHVQRCVDNVECPRIPASRLARSLQRVDPVHGNPPGGMPECASLQPVQVEKRHQGGRTEHLAFNFLPESTRRTYEGAAGSKLPAWAGSTSD